MTGKRIRGLLCVLLLVSCLTGCGDFDAKGYVQASLDAMFQGETESLMNLQEGSSKSALNKAYKENIAGFAEGLTEGLDVSEATQLQFQMLCENIFRTMRYQVEEAEKLNSKEYHVKVTYAPSDVFLKWTEYLAENAIDIQKRADAGEYQGTEEEVQEQIQQDIAAESLELLDTAMLHAAYGEEESIVLTVKEGENGDFALDEEEIADFTAKILCLDEILG